MFLFRITSLAIPFFISLVHQSTLTGERGGDGRRRIRSEQSLVDTLINTGRKGGPSSSSVKERQECGGGKHRDDEKGGAYNRDRTNVDERKGREGQSRVEERVGAEDRKRVIDRGRGMGHLDITTDNAMEGDSGNQYDDRTFQTLERIKLESLRDVDPLGGLYHENYYRDPMRGYAPQYAPRHYGQGGRIDYPSSQTILTAEKANTERETHSHLTEKLRLSFQAEREATRAMKFSEVRDYISDSAPDIDADVNAYREKVAGKTIQNLFDHVISLKTPVSYVSDQARMARRRAEEAIESGAMSLERDATAEVSFSDAVRDAAEKKVDKDYQLKKEAFVTMHGLRDQERYEYDYTQRTSRISSFGLDMDRAERARRLALPGQNPMNPLVPSSSMKEAQENLRKNSIVDIDRSLAFKIYQNTLVRDPKLGAALTDSVLATQRLEKQESVQKKKKADESEFGEGRQFALCQDFGPDRRELKPGVNDERLYKASLWAGNAYREADGYNRIWTDPRNPYDRNDTEEGVSALMKTKFDVDRRESMHAKGMRDITEQGTRYYGIPIRQQLDSFVRTRKNARGDRPTDYFLPFPTSADMRLGMTYRDVEGFPLLMRGKFDFLEYELFSRYRAHHQQRRNLALLRGLEPKMGETAQERDVRRAKLDALCESTPFDPSLQLFYHGQVKISADGLRKHFGAYFLPTPTLYENLLNSEGGGNLAMVGGIQTTTVEMDAREHLLSARYFNKLLVNSNYQSRLRYMPSDTIGWMPEVEVEYAMPSELVAQLSEKDKVMYNRYVTKVVQKQEDRWMQASKKRRWFADRKMYGWCVGNELPLQVVDTVSLIDGSVLTVPEKTYHDLIARHASFSSQEKSSLALLTNALYSGSFKTKELIDLCNNLSKSAGAIRVVIDQNEHLLLPQTTRTVTPLTINFEDGSNVLMDETEFFFNPLEVEGTENVSLYYGLMPYSYNRLNYIETQDYIWEERISEGKEGWTTAMVTDGLRPGMAVKARRQILDSQTGEDQLKAGYERAMLIQYQYQPFFNPNPKTVKVKFLNDNVVQDVLLSDVLIWQVVCYGPERAKSDETRKMFNTLRRYVDVSDPRGEKQLSGVHFLDKYREPSTEDTFRSVKQIIDIDAWNILDQQRSDNYRPLDITHRKDYVNYGYLPQYTPWNFIIVQESDAPMVEGDIRSRDTDASYLFEPHRYWRWKRRPFGYLQHYGSEVRDLLQYVDGVTPWKTAQKIRTLWEVRQHHPMPVFHRPEMSMHRNSSSLLPTYAWDIDKKTNRVKALKESLKGYQVQHEYPSWVQL